MESAVLNRRDSVFGIWDSADAQMVAIFKESVIHPVFCRGEAALILSCLHKWQV